MEIMELAFNTYQKKKKKIMEQASSNMSTKV